MLTTPKEKAKNLVEMFMNIESNKLSDYSRIYHPTAKQFALRCVNQIILANPHSNPFNGFADRRCGGFWNTKLSASTKLDLKNKT